MNKRKKVKEKILRGIINRILQNIARFAPGAQSVRVLLHRLRGVSIGKNSWIGYDSILETSSPHLIRIGNNVSIGIRCVIIAHFKTTKNVIINDDVYIGPGSIILPNVEIGKGAVIAAGSVVNKSVPPQTVVQGNPAKAIAKCKIPLRLETSYKKYISSLEPLKKIE